MRFVNLSKKEYPGEVLLSTSRFYINERDAADQVQQFQQKLGVFWCLEDPLLPFTSKSMFYVSTRKYSPQNVILILEVSVMEVAVSI